MELVKKCLENGSVWDNGKISIHHGDELKQGRKEQGVVVAMEARCSDLIQGGQLTDRSGCRPAPTAHRAVVPLSWVWGAAPLLRDASFTSSRWCGQESCHSLSVFPPSSCFPRLLLQVWDLFWVWWSSLPSPAPLILLRPKKMGPGWGPADSPPGGQRGWLPLSHSQSTRAGQKVHSAFSVRSYGKSKWTFLPTRYVSQGFPGGPVVKNGLPVQEAQETKVRSWVGKIPWCGKWQPSPVCLPGKFHGQRSLAGYSPWELHRVGHDWVTEHALISL